MCVWDSFLTHAHWAGGFIDREQDATWTPTAHRSTGAGTSRGQKSRRAPLSSRSTRSGCAQLAQARLSDGALAWKFFGSSRSSRNLSNGSCTMEPSVKVTNERVSPGATDKTVFGEYQLCSSKTGAKTATLSSRLGRRGAKLAPMIYAGGVALLVRPYERAARATGHARRDGPGKAILTLCSLR